MTFLGLLNSGCVCPQEPEVVNYLRETESGNKNLGDVDSVFNLASGAVVFNKSTVDWGKYSERLEEKDRVQESGFYDRIYEEFGMRFLRSSAILLPGALVPPDQENPVSAENKFRKILSSIQPINRVIEIGTFRGVATSILAYYANREVITIDKHYRLDPFAVWGWSGMGGKIIYIVTPTNAIKKNAIDSIGDFDFAFIDGGHDFYDVALDFRLVKKCGKVLFHDYRVETCEGVTRFIDSLPKDEITIIDVPFALWEKHG